MSLVLAWIDDGLLPGIGEAVRSKTGGTELILPEQLKQEIESIQTGVTLPELETPAESGHVLVGKEYIDGNGMKKAGTLLVSETIEYEEYIGDPGVGVLLKVKSTADDSSATIELPEPNLQPENIKSGLSIFGVVGTAISSSFPSQIDHIIGGTLTPAEAIITYIDIDVDITWTPKILLLWTEDAVTDGSIIGKVAGITILSGGLPYPSNYSVAIATSASSNFTRMAWGYAVGQYISSESVVRLYGTEKALAAGWKYNWLLMG